jgi:hypothetical protein
MASRRVILLAAAVLALSAATVQAQSNLLDAAKGLLNSGGDTGSVLSPTFGGGSLLGGSLSAGDIAAGLRDALKVGTERVVGQVGRDDGYNADPEIHIPLPDTLASVQNVLRSIGLSGMADDLELRLNRAAEAAAPGAKEVFWTAITQMTLEDAKAIYDGPPDAATRYFQRTMTPPLAERLRPVIDEALSQVGAIASYDAMMSNYKSVPFVPDVKADLIDYTVRKAMEGLFHYLAKEEAAIRDNPAKRTTDILRKVFGA